MPNLVEIGSRGSSGEMCVFWNYYLHGRNCLNGTGGCGIAEIVGSGGESEQAVQQSEEMGALSADSDWHALSQKEEADLDTIMSQCEFAISNAEKFADQLSRDLSVLDGVRCGINMKLVCCVVVIMEEVDFE